MKGELHLNALLTLNLKMPRVKVFFNAGHDMRHIWPVPIHGPKSESDFIARNVSGLDLEEFGGQGGHFATFTRGQSDMSKACLTTKCPNQDGQSIVRFT